jgi:hypothetical protein
VSARQCFVGQNCNGTSGRDTLKGTIGDDMYANSGPGTLYGYAGNDDLRGDGQVDGTIDRNDRVYGGPGDDAVVG